jgi:hypothetical protein
VPKRVCTMIAAAIWPLAMTMSIVLISPPVLTLYDAGAMGGSPVAPITVISLGALAVSVVFCFAVRSLLHYAVRRRMESNAEQLADQA